MPNIGDSIDRYVIEAVLGEGGMGRVYRALDPRLGRRVALKVLLADGASESVRAEAAARMMREARAAAAFGHANVVAIHDVGEVSGSPYIAMELVSGSTLRAYVGDPQTPHAHKLAWLLDVARGLGAAHRAGLVHRDIKPENVMVTTEGVVKILDFGIARRAESPEAVDSGAPTAAAHLSSLTAEGMMIGTPQYMPPEQLQGEPLDGRADQFAWGVMAWELFAGVLPWGASKNGAQLVAAVLATPVRPLNDVVPDVDPALSDAVARAVSKSRDARFATMDELLSVLDGKRPPAPISAPRSQNIAFEATTAQPSVRGAAPLPPTRPSAMPPVLAAAPMTPTTGGASAVARSTDDLTRTGGSGRTPIVVGVLAAIALGATGIAMSMRHEAKPANPAAQSSLIGSAPAPASAASPSPTGSVAAAAGPLVGACKDGIKNDCGAGTKAWCDVHDQPVACCGAGLVPTGDDGVCGCPPGGAAADAGASGCPTAKGNGVGNAEAMIQAIRPHLRACIGCGKGGIRSYERAGLLIPEIIEPNGVRWFDIDAVKKLAEAMKRGRRKASGRKNSPPRRESPVGYYPELNSRRLAPSNPTLGQPTSAARSPGPTSTPPRGIGPKTTIRPEWWDGDLSSNEVADHEGPESADPKTRKPPGEEPPSRK